MNNPVLTQAEAEASLQTALDYMTAVRPYGVPAFLNNQEFLMKLFLDSLTEQMGKAAALDCWHTYVQRVSDHLTPPKPKIILQ